MAFKAFTRRMCCLVVLLSLTIPFVSSAQIKWEMATDKLTKNSYNGVVVFQNKMWSIAGMDRAGATKEAWCSSNGFDWVKVGDNLPFPMVRDFGIVAFKEHIYIIGGQVAA